MTIAQVQIKINNQFPNDNLTVVEYKTMKKPMTVECKICHKVFYVQRAESFFKRKTDAQRIIW